MIEAPRLTVPLLMDELLTPALAETISASAIGDPFGGVVADTYLGPRARWLFSAVLASLDLARTDEIAILTTSNDVYVSICVSVPAFNFCRISRVVTDATKIVVVVHEFGYAFPDIAAQAADWRARGMVIIEDCAHVVGLLVDGKPVGSFGDFSFFSLSKILPTPVGGLLRTRRPVHLPPQNLEEEEATATGRKAMEAYLPHHEFFSSRRLQRHELTSAAVGRDRIYSPASPAIPFLTYVAKYDESLTPRLKNKIHLAATLRNNVWLIPTNPLVALEAYKDALEVFT